jgi:hypothetical protein
MKRLTILGLLALLPLCAGAATVDLGSHGSLAIDVPSGWTLSTEKQESGVSLTLTPPGDLNARCIVGVAFVDPAQSITRDKLQEQVLNLGDQFVDASVERKKVLRELNPKGSFGYYCVFTDASMVGRPAKKDEFRVLAVGAVRLGDSIAAAVSIAADDEKGADFQAMLAAVTSALVTAPK